MTWSTQNGKLLYKSKAAPELNKDQAGTGCNRNNLKGYAVYRSDEKDTTYTSWWSCDFDKIN